MEFLNKPENICNPLQVWDFVTMCPSSPKRPRRTYDEQELDQLETVFAKNPYPDRDHRAALAQQMKVSPKNIQVNGQLYFILWVAIPYDLQNSKVS